MTETPYHRAQTKIDVLSDALRGEGIREQRNRFLIHFASSCALSIREIVSMRLWQLTRFSELKPETVNMPLRLRGAFTGKFPLGVYTDGSFTRISALRTVDLAAASRYVKRLADFSHPMSPVFPVVRKNGRPEADKPISVKDARHIIAEASRTDGRDKEVTSYTLRHHAIAGLLADGLCLEQTQFESGYSDLQSIRDIGRQYGYRTRRDPTYHHPNRIGICISGSVYEKFEHHFPSDVYETAD